MGQNHYSLTPLTHTGRDERKAERLLDDSRGGGIPGRFAEHAADLGEGGKDPGAGQSSEQLPPVPKEGLAEVPRFGGRTGVAKAEVTISS